MAQFPTAITNRPVDPVVQSLTFALANRNDSFIYQKVLKPTPTASQSTGTIMGINIETFFGDSAASYERGEGGTYSEAFGPKLSNTTFRCQEYGRMVGVDRKTLSRSELPADLRAVHNAQIMTHLRIAQEVRGATMFGTAANWTNSTTVAAGSKWDSAGGDPIGNLETAIETVAGYGLRPNTIIMGRQARRTLQKSPVFLEFLPTTGDRNIVPTGMLKGKLAELFEVSADRIFFGDSVRNTAHPGKTVSLADIWGDWVWVGYLDVGSVPIEGGVSVQPTAAARFVEQDWEMVEWEDEARNSVVTRVSHSEDDVVIQAQLGYLIDDVTT